MPSYANSQPPLSLSPGDVVGYVQPSSGTVTFTIICE